MKLTLNMNVSGVQQQMDVIIDEMGQLDRTLRRFGKYMRLKSQLAFSQQGPGWPALAPSTVAHREKKATSALESRLGRDVARAEKNARAHASKNVSNFYEMAVGAKKKEKVIERRESVLAEFKRLEAGGRTEAALVTEKQQAKLKGRMQKAKEKASTQILGKMSSSIKASVKKNTLTVESSIPWSGVHNDGGGAGHGASIPARTFLEIEAEDLDVFVAFLMDAVEEGLG